MKSCPACNGRKMMTKCDKSGAYERNVFTMCRVCMGSGEVPGIEKRSFEELVDAISDRQAKVLRGTPQSVAQQMKDALKDDPKNNKAPQNLNNPPSPRPSPKRPPPAQPRELAAGVFTDRLLDDRTSFRCDLSFRTLGVPALFQLLGVHKKTPAPFYYPGGPKYACNE